MSPVTKPVLELWTTGAGVPGYAARAAARAESEGWDGIGMVDSQNLVGDPYVELALAAHKTTTIRLGTAVTNPLTRHPAATATAIATVQAESGGRALLGIGRGDSSLAHPGLAPAPVAVFRRYLERLQGYLRGEDVPFDVEGDGAGEVASSSSLGMAGGPAASRIRWLPPGMAKVPVDVAATGPQVIAAAAVLADRVTFAVGADPERIAWAVGVARNARTAAGLDPGALGLGAYLPVFPHPDREVARASISGAVASFARFSVMHGSVIGPIDDRGRAVLEQVHDAYDMDRHFTQGSPQSTPLTDEVIDAFAIAGPAGWCAERLAALGELGLSKIVVMPAGRGLDRDAHRAAHRLLVDEVLPTLR